MSSLWSGAMGADGVVWWLVPRLLLYAGLALATYILYYQLVKPLTSPLLKIPGMPFKPIVGSMAQITGGKDMDLRMDMLKRMIDKYGTICRFYFVLGRERVLVADPDTIKHILVTNCKNYRKPTQSFLRLLRTILGDGLIILEGPEHATHKRLMSPSFNNAAIKKMVTVFSETGQQLAAMWAEQAAGGRVIVNVQNDLGRTTLDVIGKTAFGYDFNSLENPHDPVVEAFQGVIEGKSISWMMVLPGYMSLPFSNVRRFKAEVSIMHGKVQEIIRRRRQELKAADQAQDEANTATDILSIMMMAKDEQTGQGLSDLELQHEVMTLMGAGHETTATGMSWFLLLMAQNPEAQQKVREEIQLLLPDADSPITWEMLDKFHYLGLCIKECLRLHPPVPITAREAQEADQLGPYHVPAHTVCLLAIAPMMRSAELFEDPNSFRPERFDTSDDENKNMYRFLPFLIGPRMCLGYKFALIEMKVILARLLRQLKFELIPGTKFRPSHKNRITMRPDPPLVLYASQIPQ